jgi:hypothetical protein
LGPSFRVYPQAPGLSGKLTAHINLHFLMAYPTAIRLGFGLLAQCVLDLSF